MDVVEKNINQVRDLCTRHKVSKLFVFGSVLTTQFNQDSDVDFIVDFKNVGLTEYADNYFEFKFALEKILNRDIDLLEEKAIRNPYLLKSINSTKKLVYG